MESLLKLEKVIARGRTAEIFAWSENQVRNMAFNLLRQNKSKKCGAKTKRMFCAMDTIFLLEVFNS